MVLRAYVDPGRRLITFWSPKCGSRSLSHWFYQACTPQPEEHRRDPGHYLNHHFHVPYPRAARLVLDEGYRSILATRHPSARVLSAFLDKFVARRNRDHTRLDQALPYVREVIEDILSHRQGGISGGVRFREFLDYLGRHRDRPETLNAHWAPQFDPDYFARPVPFHHLLRVERFDDDLVALNLRLGLESLPPVIHKNRSRTAKAKQDLPAGALLDAPVDELVDREVSPSAFLDTATMTWMGAFYQSDFDVLGYDPQQPRSACGLEVSPYEPTGPGLPGTAAAGAKKGWRRLLWR